MKRLSWMGSVLNTDDFTVTKLNAMGGFCWSMLYQTQTLHSLIQAVHKEYESVSETVEKDIEAFLSDLIQCGLLKHASCKETMKLISNAMRKYGEIDLPAHGNSMFSFIRQRDICRFASCDSSRLIKGDNVLSLWGKIFWSHRGQRDYRY